MGSVYLSRTRGNQPVALKVIRREYARDPEFRRRFEQEARAARQVRGYHVVPVLDHDTAGAVPWLATAYVPGLALDDVLALYGPLPQAAALQLTGCAAEALHAVHKAGVIHRDLKPSNVLIGSDGPWVIDFGIARAADATQLTRSGGFIGTPQYMSPEHANGLPLTPATDVFSLGLIAAVCATGRHPYGDAGAITVATQIANTAVRPPDLAGYPEPLRGLLERCLAADPQDRPSPSELAGLCQALAGRDLRDFREWLPGPLAADIAGRERAAHSGLAAPTTGTPYGGGTTRPPAPAAAGTGAGAGTGGGSAATDSRGPGRPPVAGAVPPHPQGPPGAVTAPGPPGRRVSPLTVGAAAVAVAALVFAGWTYARDDTEGDAAKDGAATGTGRPAASGTPQGGATAPAGGASPKAGTYKVVFQDQSFALRWPSTGYTKFDLDAPQAVPSGADSSRMEMSYAQVGGVRDNYELHFETPTGVSEDADPAHCKTSAGANALSAKIEAAQVAKQIVPGTILCTVTKEGKLAMMRIVQVDANDGRPDFLTRLTLWELP